MITYFDYSLQQADMVFTGLTITKERSEAVDFSYPFFEETSVVVFRLYDHKEAYFYRPLQWKVTLPQTLNILCQIFHFIMSPELP